MPTFLPLQAISRSQRVRIGGQTVSPTGISFVDVGIVDPPATAYNATLTGSAGATKTGKLAEGKYYAYVITAVDASGNETIPSPEVVVKTVAEAEPSAKTEWTAVPHAAKYRVYATPAAGGASEAAASTEALALIGETASTEFVDTGQVRQSAIPPTSNTTKYNVLGGAWSTRKELQNHFAIGAVQQLGGYTKTNLNIVPLAVKGENPFAISFASEEVKVVKAANGAIVRSDGHFYSEEVAALAATGFKSGGTTKTRLGAVVLNTRSRSAAPGTAAKSNLIGKLELIEGTEATSEAQTQAEFEANLANKITHYQQVLYIVQVKVKTVTNVTSTYLKGAGTPSLGDTVNLPVVDVVW